MQYIRVQLGLPFPLFVWARLSDSLSTKNMKKKTLTL